MTLSRLHLLLLGFVVCCTNGYTQPKSADETTPSLNKALALFHQSLGDQSGIYNGSIYLRPTTIFNEGHVYFKTDSFSKGNILYDGMMYFDVPLLYDEEKDVLVTKDFSGLSLVQLINQKVSSFSLGPYEFNAVVQSNGKPAFYRVVHRGNFVLLHRELKFTRRRIVRENEYFTYVETQSSYWLQKDGRLTAIDSYRQLMNLFGDARKQVQEHIRRKGLKYREAIEPTIIEALNYFESLQPR